MDQATHPASKDARGPAEWRQPPVCWSWVSASALLRRKRHRASSQAGDISVPSPAFACPDDPGSVD